MEALPYDLFQLMQHLSRIQNADRILTHFIESMNSLFTGVHFCLAHSERMEGYEMIDIETTANHFGRLAIDYQQAVLPGSRKKLILGAIDMLAVLLENRKQIDKLRVDKEYIRKEWQKQNEIIHEREEQYKTLSENSEDLVLRFDKEHRIVYANSCTEKVYDCSKSEMLHKQFREFDLPQEHGDFWFKHLERVFNLGISVNERLAFPRPSRKSYYDIRFVPEKNEAGDVVYVIATARDITELIIQGKELFNSQWHLNQAQRIAHIGSWEWNIRYNKIILSNEMYKILGHYPKDLVLSFETLPQYLKGEIMDYIQRFQQQLPEKIDNFELETSFVRTDNQIRFCMVRGEAMYSSNGKIKKVHGTMQDITDRKFMETEIETARQKAEESDRLKSAFLANMSHEIRTPLNGILGFSELLRRKNLTSDKRQFYTDIICSNSKQLLKIISDIIDISKIEAGQIVIDRAECQISVMLQELLAFFISDFKNKSKKIELVLEEDPCFKNLGILCDEIRLRQIFSNLLSNAGKFTNQGQIRFGYKIQAPFIEFYVIDTGIGIKPEHQQLVFERFRQANDSVSREYGGTGLGLAICKSLVELMGGNIWVVSQEEVGSEFHFTLPLIQPRNLASELQFEMPGNGVFIWPGKRILVVEDDMPSIELLRETLGESSAEVVYAEDGEMAIRMHQDVKPHLILMDIRIPKINGLEAIRTIRGNDKQVAIIALTANAFVEDRMKCLTAGSNEYISKPVDRNHLLSLIDKFIR